VTVATVYHAVDNQKQQTTLQQQKLEELQKQLTSKQKESLEQPVYVNLPSPTVETSPAVETPPPPTDTPPTELPGRP
jgi:hypothetical protein